MQKLKIILSVILALGLGTVSVSCATKEEIQESLYVGYVGDFSNANNPQETNDEDERMDIFGQNLGIFVEEINRQDKGQSVKAWLEEKNKQLRELDEKKDAKKHAQITALIQRAIPTISRKRA